jgi:hypothetical protein
MKGHKTDQHRDVYKMPTRPLAGQQDCLQNSGNFPATEWSNPAFDHLQQPVAMVQSESLACEKTLLSPYDWEEMGASADLPTYMMHGFDQWFSPEGEEGLPLHRLTR